MKQAILVEQNITEPKTLPANSSDAAGIEEVAETTPLAWSYVPLPANASHPVDVGASVFNEKKITSSIRLQKFPLPTISRRDLKKAKLQQRVDMQDTDGDGQLDSSSHGGNDISVDPKVFDPPISDKKHEIWNKKLHGICGSILAVMFTLLWGNQETTNNLLPVSSNDLANAPRNALTFIAFLGSALHIPLQQRAIILTVFGGILRHIIQNPISIPPYEFQGGIKTISFGEAIFVFSHVIAYISLFITAYIMSWTLIMGLPSGLLIFLAVLLTFAPFLLLPHLLRNASATGIQVACGGFNLPANGFTVVATFGFCLFFLLVVLLVLYTIWSFMYRKTPAARGQDAKVTDSLFSAGIDSTDLNPNDDD